MLKREAEGPQSVGQVLREMKTCHGVKIGASSAKVMSDCGRKFPPSVEGSNSLRPLIGNTRAGGWLRPQCQDRKWAEHLEILTFLDLECPVKV